MGPEFFQTRMGQRFYEVTAPKIADELARLNENLAAIAQRLDRLLQAVSGKASPTTDPPPDAS